MPAKGSNQWVQISGYLFILGVLVSVVAGVMPGVIPSADVILVILGAVVGLLGALGTGSIDRGEAESFLLAAVGLIAVGASGAALSNFPGIGETYLKPIVQNIAVFVAPAVVLVALETIWRAGSVRLS